MTDFGDGVPNEGVSPAINRKEVKVTSKECNRERR